MGNVYVVNPKTGEVKKIYVGNRRLKTIYNTNMKVAYSHSRYKSQMQSHGEYFRYIAVLDNKTRPTHASHHGLILPKDDPFWDTHYPPNAWNCRCKVRVYTKKQLERKGWKVAHTPPPFAHKDWAYHVGKTDNNARLLKIYKDKANKIDDIALKNLANKSAYKIADELAKRLSIFKAIKQMFETPLKDAKTSKNKIPIAKATDEIKKAFNDEKLDQIYLSEWTIASHKHHKNITAFDYYLLIDILSYKALNIRDGNTPNAKVFIYNKMNKKYKIVLKKTDIFEIYIQSVTKGSSVK